MSSTTDTRLAMIGAAIDELAEAARAGTGTPGRQGTHGVHGPPPDSMAEQVARIWAMVAALDPALAQRLSWYTDQGPETSRPG